MSSVTGRTGRAKLTAEEVVEIYESGRGPVEIAAWYGVDPSTVYKIRTGRIWRHVTRHNADTFAPYQIEIGGDE